MLIVGGGPAGAAAAIYTARKGFRTGIAAERFGGQVLDTLGIENFISVPLHRRAQARAPARGARARERHRRDEPGRGRAADPGEAARRVARGRAQERRDAVGARGGAGDRRALAQPRGAGRVRVPQPRRRLLPALRRAAVQGQARGGDRRRQLGRRGGDRPRQHRRPRDADRVRRQPARRPGAAGQAAQPEQRRHPPVGADHRDHRRRRAGRRPGLQEPRLGRRSTGSSSTACSCRSGWCPTPSGSRIRGWRCRATARSRSTHKAATNLPGVFAAGDCTTVPYKQIVIAMGEGSKAALSAFDYIIRNAPAEDIAEAA